jgi:mitogen-activated protein kinase kinase
LQPLSKPQTITEEAEEGDETETAAVAVGKLQLGGCQDNDVVAFWVKAALARKADEPNAKANKPALHKVALVVAGNNPQTQPSE